MSERSIANPVLSLPVLSLIVAKSRNGVIGVDGNLPWRLSSDLKFFKQVTIGKPVLMGRVTWESLPFALPGRPNLVLTRDAGYKITGEANGAEVFTDVKSMIGRGYELAGAMGEDELMLIGGATLYANLMPYCGRMYVTEIDEMIDGDAHFPAILADQWRCVAKTAMAQGPKDDFPFTICIYERK